jgi:hypothetical protein
MNFGNNEEAQVQSRIFYGFLVFFTVVAGVIVYAINS